MIKIVIIIVLKPNLVGQSTTKPGSLVEAQFDPGQCKNKNDYYYIFKTRFRSRLRAKPKSHIGKVNFN
jgi:hypothetical protein